MDSGWDTGSSLVLEPVSKTYFAAILRATSLSGPGGGTNIASR